MNHTGRNIRDVSEKIQSESDSILNLINNSKVNEALEKLMNCIFLAAHCMKQTHVDHTDTHRKQPWFDKSCKDMKTKTLRALRFFRQTLTERALNAYLSLKNLYRNLSKKGRLYRK